MCFLNFSVTLCLHVIALRLFSHANCGAPLCPFRRLRLDWNVNSHVIITGPTALIRGQLEDLL